MRTCSLLLSLPGNYAAYWWSNLLVTTVVYGLTISSEILQTLPTTTVQLEKQIVVSLELISGQQYLYLSLDDVFWFLVDLLPTHVQYILNLDRKKLMKISRNIAESKVGIFWKNVLLLVIALVLILTVLLKTERAMMPPTSAIMHNTIIIRKSLQLKEIISFIKLLASLHIIWER